MSPIIDPVTEYSDWIDASSSKGVVMARYATTVETSKTPKKVFAYMADLRNFAEWDPGVKAVTQVKGSGGGPGTVFDVTVAGVGRDLTLRYVTEEYEAPRNLLVVAHSAVFTSIDRITVEPDGKGSVITYDAALRLNGVLHVGDLGLQLMFGVIGDRVRYSDRRALRYAPAGLPVPRRDCEASMLSVPPATDSGNTSRWG